MPTLTHCCVGTLHSFRGSNISARISTREAMSACLSHLVANKMSFNTECTWTVLLREQIMLPEP